MNENFLNKTKALVGPYESYSSFRNNKDSYC